MANNVKGVDLIGKTITVNGSNVKYVIKSVDGDKLMTDFIMGDRTMPCPVPMSQVESMVEAGKWTIESEEPTATENKTEDVKPKATATEETTATEEVEEVIDEPEPVKAATIKMQPKDKAEEKTTKSKPQKPQTKAKSDTSHQTSTIRHLKYETYTTRKGKTGAKIVGFHETDAAYLAGPDLHGSKAWENDKQGNKTFCLLFSHRYAEAAKDVCTALNQGKSVADCQAIIDATTEERAQRREEWKQKRAERDNATTNEGEATAKTGKLYTEAEVRKAFATLASAADMDVKEFEPIIQAMQPAA